MTSTFGKYKTIVIILLIMVFGAISLFTWFFIRDMYLLTTRSYIIDPENLVRIDSIATGGIVNTYTSNTYNGKPQIVYETSNGQHFNITGVSYKSITYPNELIDLLRRDGFLFSVFTNRKDREYFKSGRKPATIEIYQLIIRRRAYINIYKANELERKRLTWNVVLWNLAIGFLLYSLFAYKRYLKRMHQSTAKIINL